MSGPQFGWLLAALTAASAAVIALLAWDLHRRLPRTITARHLIADAEQLCWDNEFQRITNHLEQP